MQGRSGFFSRSLLKVAGFLFSFFLIFSFLLIFSVENLKPILIDLFSKKNINFAQKKGGL